ncbi:MtnX-like HAD-IB family phosphatase [Rossellomorea aquimaris]|uniref:2,3-diketo-5-methylthio-1-phosphopentane phosphatase n=1 Tax=Rossellomorea aquimaris TaxID=189382 RepID=A0A1J6X143_9BACI|nr:MtnX-like HAD-IB family phosphatase [Rossellomorea aquimaris]OIU71857.1 2,3-diketo-5-methylthio-1-phosphopentane phosphatase [Rossellomorea aquimaris]
MKKWAFVSDFDGTITKKDFYQIVIDKYFNEGNNLYNKWKSEEVKDIDFLASVFSSINQEEDIILEDIKAIEIDEYVPAFIKNVQNNNGDFYILSAGTNYYIHHLLNHYGVKGVKVFSNEGYYKDNNVHLHLESSHPHYSERYGIDKSKVIADLKKEYDLVYFAGDSEPDSHPAKIADETFAFAQLQDLLKKQSVPCIHVDNFKEIEYHLRKKGLLQD